MISHQQAMAALRAARGPAWIIVPAEGRIAAANDAGAAIVGSIGTLDSAMPALARLRDIVRGIEPVISAPRPLLFWTRRGSQVLACTIELVGQEGAQPVSVLVQVPAARPEASPAPKVQLNVDEPPQPMDDAATLREIARRIQEGTAALAGRKGEVPVASSDGIRITEAEPASVDADAATAPAASGGGPECRPPASLPLEAAGSDEAVFNKHTLGKLAHELKTPLSAIAAAAEIMRDERLGAIGNARYRDYATDIHSGATHALRLIERLLQPLAQDHNAREADIASAFQSVDVNKLVAGVVSSLGPLAVKAGIEISSELAEGLAPLTCDPTSLRQILFNLLTNAIKFLRPGDRVRVITSIDSRGTIAIEVDDTGPGMSREEISRALEPVGAVPEGARAGGGMGLGLPLVKSLAEANAGRLSIDSRLGHGTRVVVTFPRNRLIAI